MQGRLHLNDLDAKQTGLVGFVAVSVLNNPLGATVDEQLDGLAERVVDDAVKAHSSERRCPRPLHRGLDRV